MQADSDRISAAVERRLATVEGMIPPVPAWRGADERDLHSNRIAVVAGPAVRPGAHETPQWVLVAGVATITVALALSVFGGFGIPRPTPGWADRFPNQTVAKFERPFTYAIDPASGIERDDVSPRLQQFRISDPANPTRFSRIVAVRFVDVVRVDPCRSAGGTTVQVNSAAQFVDYLRSIRGLEVSTTVEAIVDGRPALQVYVTNGDEASCTKVYVWPNESAFTDTAAARRIQAFEVDGATILVATAVAKSADLDAWLTTADQFIATIQFIDLPPSQSVRP